jgi:hypothetical protein
LPRGGERAILLAVDELEERLKRRDHRFLVRLALSVAVVLLAGTFLFLKMKETDVGGCAARGFETLTGSPAAEPGQ